MQDKCGTTIGHVGLHALRHTFASYLIRNNVDIAVVSSLLGHKKVSTTYYIYVHIIDAQKAKAIQTLDVFK